jgi:aspartyl-tRNA(Asn)/glutamyl-tRNA(Gln) amidotransferase subunit A
MSNDALDAPIREIAARLRAGTITIEQMIETAIARHARFDEALGAYKHWDGDGARRAAAAAAAALEAGYDLGPLMGLPVSFKDIFGVASMPSFAGTPNELPHRWRREGPVVAAMRRQLAVITGKTHSVEFAFGGVGATAHWPSPRNPWDGDAPRAAGGSSVGAGVSVAEGSALVAFGTDTGGSVRIPASVTGQVGLKTTIGRWSTAGIVPLSASYDTPGLFTRDVEDAILAFAAVDPAHDDEAALLARLDGLAAGDLRLAICDEHFWDDCAPGIAEGVKAALDELTAAGARLATIALPEAAEARARFLNGGLFGVEGLSVLEEHLPQWIATLDPNIGARFEAARMVSAVTYFTEQRKLGELARAVDDRLGQYDALVAPTVPITPPTLAEMADEKAYGHANMMMTRNTQPVNLLGLCAVTIPVALDAAAMPVGMQLIARAGAEERLLATALACEKTLGTARRRLGVPPLCR